MALASRSLIILALIGVALAAKGSSVRHLTSTDFDEVTSDGKVYFVKFYAPWCGHCKKLAPTWEKLAKAYEGSEEAAVVPGFPSLKIYFNGEQKESFRSARDYDTLKTFFDENIAVLQGETVA
ncbi:Protein disulfide-isomerase 1 [Auxenochlorella protothecoides]|uniref:Protein disulfide-isomerase 1 n=1 Tax=Auxenochlorella protothecoides TaxID=3075 RepID=A0A087SMS0_AUXPR|nr:Protein disulfide-isomerase 1 [Auxenochlorella protothecoides]KFM27024.1 Protein disulfide-isomerase 1 [Auxenochlorella protothecoides]